MEARDGLLLHCAKEPQRRGEDFGANGVEEESASVLCALATFSQPLSGALPALRAR